MKRLLLLASMLAVGLFGCDPVPSQDAADGGPPALPGGAPTAEAPSVERFPHREALFGDLHVHTSWSTDAYFYGSRVGPRDAWRFARGEAVRLPVGIVAQLAAPLDFAAITDHAEGFDRIGMCTDPEHPMYGSPACENTRNPQVDIEEFFARAMSQAVQWPRPRNPQLCANSTHAQRPRARRGGARRRWRTSSTGRGSSRR